MKKKKTYSIPKESADSMMACEPAVSLTNAGVLAPSPNLLHASIANGILQVTSDIEEEIAEAEQGETVSMEVFKTMFTKWLDQ